MGLFGSIAKAVKSVGKAVGKTVKNPSGFAVGMVSQQWLADTVARKLVGDKVYKTLAPANILPAADLLHTVGSLTPKDIGKLAQGDRSKLKLLTGQAVKAVAASQQFGDTAGKLAPGLKTQADELTKGLALMKGPNADTIRQAVERARAGIAVKQSTAANALLRAYNGKDPAKRTQARAEVGTLTKRARAGDRAAAASLTLFHRRAAAVRAAGKFKVDASGMVRA
jgi:hypothetical protein